MNKANKIYIGDGVYMHFDGWYIVLTTDRYGVEHRIALEPNMLEELIRFGSQVWKRSEVQENENE